MNAVWRRAALLSGGVLALAAAAWATLGLDTALAVCIAGLGFVLLRHLRHLGALAEWLRDPSHRAVPEGTGLWDDIFTTLYRMVRASDEQRKRLTTTLARFRSAGQAMPDGVIVLDADNHIEWCNTFAEAFYGLDAAKDVGRPIVNLVRQPDFIAYIDAGRFGEPLVMRVQGGGSLVLSVRVIPYGQDQKLLLARDITQAEKLETMRRDFVANVSHELKTPITVISGFLETIGDGTVKLDEMRGRQVMEIMRHQSQRMQRLVEDLLMLSALESSTVPADEAPINMQRLMGELAEEARALSGGRHDIRTESPLHAALHGSETELRSAFSNLISNAVRYTPPGGAITLEWVERGADAVFSVQDSGIGIDPQHIPRLTERFYRVDSSRSRETGGTGLGLAIVKHALNRHQAVLDITSEAGKGSRFSAVFPSRRLRREAAAA